MGKRKEGIVFLFSIFFPLQSLNEFPTESKNILSFPASVLKGEILIVKLQRQTRKDFNGRRHPELRPLCLTLRRGGDGQKQKLESVFSFLAEILSKY